MGHSGVRTALGVVVALLGLALPPMVSAQAGPPPDLASASIEELMNVLVTTASRGSEEVAAAPARVQVINAAQIRRRGYRSVLDVLKDLPDFKIDIAGDPDYPAELTVQGTRGAGRVVLLLDGIRVSSPTNEPLPIVANYPVHNARQVEIVYGPASAIYGADAFSAVINIISKDVSEASGLALSSSIGQSGLYNQTGSYGVRLGASADLMIAGQYLYDHQPDLSAVYPEEYRGLEGQRTGIFNTIYGEMTAGSPVSPGYDIPLSAHSIQARLVSGGLVVALFHNRARISTSPANNSDNAVYNPAAFNDNRLLSTSGSYTRLFGRITSTSTLAYSRQELTPKSGYWNVFSNLKKSFKYAYGSMTKAEQQFSWKPRRSTTVTSGATFERFFSIPQGADLNAAIESQDQPGTILDTNITDDFVKLRYSNTGAYVQMQHALNPVVTLTLGARGDYNTRFGGTFNPRLGLVVRPTGSTTVKMLYGTAFLAPSPYQAYSHYGSFFSTDGGQTYASSYWHVENPDLKPQQKRTVELNVLQALGGNVQLSTSLFYSRFTSLIQQSDADEAGPGFFHGWPVEYIVSATNDGHAYTYGGSIAADFIRVLGVDRRVEVHASSAFVDGREWADIDTGVGAPTGGMSPVQLHVGGDLDWDSWSVAPRLSVAGTQRLLATIQAVDGSAVRRTLPGYATLDVNIRRTLLRNIDAFVTIENAFDRRYRTINSLAYINTAEMIGVPQNPRRITVGFSLRVR